VRGGALQVVKEGANHPITKLWLSQRVDLALPFLWLVVSWVLFVLFFVWPGKSVTFLLETPPIWVCDSK